MKSSLLKILLFTGTIPTLQSLSQTPDFQWARGLGSSNTIHPDIATDVVCDRIGATYTTGYYGDVTDFDPGPGTYNLVGILSHSFVLKLDSSGNFVWAKDFTNNFNRSRSIAIDNLANIVVGGSISAGGPVDFDPGPGQYNLSNPYPSAYICKLDSSGNFLWAGLFSPLVSGGGAETISIALDDSGNVYATGYFMTQVDFDPGVGVFPLSGVANWKSMFVCKLSANGVFRWAKMIGTSGWGANSSNDIAVDDEGNSYVTGEFGSTVDFDPGPDTFNLIATASDAFILKLNQVGNLSWAKKVDCPGTDYSYTLSLDSSCRIVIGGHFNGSADFDPGPGSFIITGVFESYLLKLDSAGSFIWALTYGSLSPYGVRSIAIDTAGCIYTLGIFNVSGLIDFDPGPGTFYINVSPPSTYAGILKFDTMGTFLWARTMGLGNLCEGRSLSIGMDGSIYSVGMFEGVIDFHPDSLQLSVSSNGYQDFYVQKFGLCYTAPPSSSNSIYGPDTICVGTTNTYNISPIPGVYSYIWILPSGWTGTNISNSISPMSSSAGGTITVIPYNACGLGTPIVFNVTVLNIPSTFNYTSPLCYDSCNASASVTATGTPPLSYLWQPGGYTNSSVSGLCADTYIITITDGNGCVVSPTYNLPPPIPLNVFPFYNIPSCSSCCDGFAFAISTGGATPYTYQWLPGGQTTDSIFSLCVGTYTVCVMDANGCSICDDITINYNLGMMDPIQPIFHVSPNPSNGLFSIKSNIPFDALHILNALGARMFSLSSTEKSFYIDLSNEPPGIYIAQISLGIKLINIKLVKTEM